MDICYNAIQCDDMVAVLVEAVAESVRREW